MKNKNIFKKKYLGYFTFIKCNFLTKDTFAI